MLENRMEILNLLTSIFYVEGSFYIYILTFFLFNMTFNWNIEP